MCSALNLILTMELIVPDGQLPSASTTSIHTRSTTQEKEIRRAAQYLWGASYYRSTIQYSTYEGALSLRRFDQTNIHITHYNAPEKKEKEAQTIN